MIDYLKNLLPRLKEFSASLDKIEVFVDRHWVFIDNNGNQHTYIFKRDGRLIMSLNGDAQTGKWEFLAAAKSILVDRNVDKILLNQALVFDGLMFLKKDGTESDPWVLVNKQVVPDLNYINYLRGLIIEKMRLKEFKLNDGRTYYYNDYNYGVGIDNGTKIYDEDFRMLTGDHQIGLGEGKKIIIKDGIVVSVIYIREYQTLKGILSVHQHNLYEMSLGDDVYFGNNKADGIIQFVRKGKIKSIEVRNGKILSVQYKTWYDLVKENKKRLLRILTFTLLLTCLIIFCSVYFRNVYSHRNDHGIKIGSQIWDTLNLNVKKYQNGDLIPKAITNEDWINYNSQKIGCWCYLRNDSSSDKKYGLIYNWYAINDSRKLAPKGWHIPAKYEFEYAINHCGGDKDFCHKLNLDREESWGHLGSRSTDGDFWNGLSFWSSTKLTETYAWFFCDCNTVDNSVVFEAGDNIRLIKDSIILK